MTFNGFDFAFSTRFNRLSFNKTKNQIDRTLNQHEFEKLYATAQTKNYLFFEPALTIRGGWKNIRSSYKVQLGVISIMNIINLINFTLAWA